MSSKKKRPVIFGGSKACVFCDTEEDDEFVFGKFFHMKTFSVHHNCMFFSSGLVQQNKKVSTGVLGFKTEDIRKEVFRGRKLRCYYCKEVGATVGCCIGSCRKTFHFPCGKKNRSLHQFFGSFNSYCDSHKPLQKPTKITKRALRCHICFSSLSKTAVEDVLYSTCCKNNCYHVTCLQQYAISAGRHFFKCPMCKNSSDFIKNMEYYGISIPEKDASWELEENAFQDLLFRPECGAPTCKCDQGRNYDEECKWELLYCKLCGSNARHRFCESLGSTVESWTCTQCKILEDQFEINKLKTQVNLEVTAQEKSTNGISTERVASDCEPTCSRFDSISCADPRLTSTSTLRRALQCVVQITPIKMVTDINGISKPVLYKNYQYGKSKQLTPIKTVSETNAMNRLEREKVTSVKILTDTIGMSTAVLPQNNEIKKKQQTSEFVTDNRIDKSKFDKINENCKRNLALSPVLNKKARLQEKVMNTLSNEKAHLQDKVINTLSNKLLTKNSASQRKKSSVKTDSRAKHHSKKIQSGTKLTKCCSNETCISKFFGLECPKLKNNRLS